MITQPSTDVTKQAVRSNELVFRSGAVARMARMPVATLRVWEQRYQAIQPSTAASGHRSYSQQDVERVLLLRQLTEQGHAIGMLAQLDTSQLHALASAALERSAPTVSKVATKSKRLAVITVGPTISLRLKRQEVTQQLNRSIQTVAMAKSVNELTTGPTRIRVDALIVQQSEIHNEHLPALLQAKASVGAQHLAVLYRFGSSATIRSFAEAGVWVVRDTGDDASLCLSLLAMKAHFQNLSKASWPPQQSLDPSPQEIRWHAPMDAVMPRRFDDAALAAMSGMRSGIYCDCPHHLAEILLQITSFEEYSKTCQSQSPADAELHAYLHKVAGSARMMFETALDKLAKHEGIRL